MPARPAHRARESVRPVNTATGRARQGIRATNTAAGSQPSTTTDPSSYWMNRCTATKANGSRCENILRTPGDKEHGMCVGHWNGRKKKADDATE